MMRRHSIALLVMTGIVGLLQLFALAHKFPRFVPSTRFPQAVPLARVASVNIGIIRGHHGAVFVRTSDLSRNPPLSKESDAAEVQLAMRRELRRVPVKLFAEWVWYVVVAFFVVYLPIVTARVRAALRRTVVLVSACAFLAAAALFQLPLAFGYDSSMFSTWAGPGAYSSSGPYLSISGNTGVSVSYRIFLEAMVLPAMRVITRCTTSACQRRSVNRSDHGCSGWRSYVSSTLPSDSPAVFSYRGMAAANFAVERTSASFSATILTQTARLAEAAHLETLGATRLGKIILCNTHLRKDKGNELPR